MNLKKLFLISCLVASSLYAFIPVQAQKYTPGKLILKTGFEDGVRVTDSLKTIVGSDTEGYSWENFSNWYEPIRFAYSVGSNKKLIDFQEPAIDTITGRDGKATRVLRLTNKADDPDNSTTSRVELSFFGKRNNEGFSEGYVRYWMKLQGNLGNLFPEDEDTPWYMIMEWKEPNSKIVKPAEECKACCDAKSGGTNNYRINIGITKEKFSNEFSWIIIGEQPQPCRKKEWEYVNKKIEVPLGEWFLVEAYMKKHETDGRVYFAVNGRVVLDTDITKPAGFTGRTQHRDNPLPLGFWSPLKNYHDVKWNKNGPVSQWYDDFELWDGFPNDHPALK